MEDETIPDVLYEFYSRAAVVDSVFSCAEYNLPLFRNY